MSVLGTCIFILPLFTVSWGFKFYDEVYPDVDLIDGDGFCDPSNSTNGTCPLFFGFLISFGGTYTSSGGIPGVQIALREINENPDILPGYTLHYTLKNSDVC